MEIQLWRDAGAVTLEREHRSGRSADVWVGSLNGDEVAVKIYRPTFDDGGFFDESVDREAEVACTDAKVVTSLGRGVVHYSGERWGHVLVFPFIDAVCINDVVKSGILEESGPRAKLAVANNLVSSLSSLHECGWIHGDIAPSNILVSEDDWSVHLIDLEFCLPTGVTFDYKSHRGTPGYTAPEIDECGVIASSFKSDVWSLGWVLAEIFNPDDVPPERDWLGHMKEHGSSRSMLNGWTSGTEGGIDAAVRKCVIIPRAERVMLSEIKEVFEANVRH